MGPASTWPEQSPEDGIKLATILRNQPLLEHLELRSRKWDMDGWLSATDLPHLRSLVAREDEARWLIPGRPITSLTFLEVDKVPEDNAWKELTASSTPITSLTACFIRKDSISPFLKSAAKYMGALRSIRICASSLRLEHLGI
ncbi:hypothetical protein FRB98_008074, partial [Tulasnella sp. 332]